MILPSLIPVHFDDQAHIRRISEYSPDGKLLASWSDYHSDSSSASLGVQLRYPESTIQNFERFKAYPLSYDLSTLSHVSFSVIAILMDSYTTEYRLAKSYPQILNTRKS